MFWEETMSHIIGFYNRKGGVAKTTSVVNIAAELAMEGKKVLVVDGDSQINLTQALSLYEGQAEEGEPTILDGCGELKEGVTTIFEVLSEDLNPYNAIQSVGFAVKKKFFNKFKNLSFQIDMMIGSTNLDYFDASDSVTLLKEKLDFLRPSYDYILIDFPPAYNMITMMNLVSCDYVIVPMELAKNTSESGYREVVRKCVEAKQEYGNKNLVFLGAYFVRVMLYKTDQAELHEICMSDNVKNNLKYFETCIREDYATYQTCQNAHAPACAFSKKTKMSEDYKNLAREIEERIEKEERNK